jgi:Golgi nucleoside diphosphatase
MISSFLSAHAFADNKNYTIFIDAGSSGSRLHIFEYEKSLPLPMIKDVFSESIKPGLSEYAAHPESAGQSLKKILDDANQFLLEKKINPHFIRVHLFATAGMRLLPEDKQQAIYRNVTNFIQNNYDFNTPDIRTISGKMEGVYSWLDVNYLLGNFQNNRTTTGTIDMGGASTQITFATNDLSKFLLI